MKKLAKLSLIALGLGIFVAALSTIPSRPVSGALGPDRVIVTNTPLPVSGTVNIGSMPNVNIGNTPNVTISGNTSASPLFVRDVDNPARQPFQIGFPFTMNPATIQVFQSFTVPVGKRLVIEYVSMGSGSVPVGQHLFIILLTTVGGVGAFHYVAVTPQGSLPPPNAADTFVASQPMRVYADPGTTVNIQMQRESGVGACEPNLTVSGYLVDVT